MLGLGYLYLPEFWLERMLVNSRLVHMNDVLASNGINVEKLIAEMLELILVRHFLLHLRPKLDRIFLK